MVTPAIYTCAGGLAVDHGKVLTGEAVGSGGEFQSHGGTPQIIQVMDNHDLVLKPMLTWGSPIFRKHPFWERWVKMPFLFVLFFEAVSFW